jgi:hypothetical protein
VDIKGSQERLWPFVSKDGWTVISKQLVLETTNISENFTMYFLYKPVLAKQIGEQ